jgi:archaellum component FlaC
MLETTEIEKKSLEAHVELCAERYNALENKLSVLEDKLSGLKTMIIEVHNMVEKMADKRTDQLIAWGIGIIGFLVATVGWLLSHYVFK